MYLHTAGYKLKRYGCSDALSASLVSAYFELINDEVAVVAPHRFELWTSSV